MSPFQLQDRVVIVTGAGRGIGRSIARVFAEAGASVVVATRTSGPGEETVGYIRENNGHAILHQCDVGELGAAAGLVEATVSAFGRLDVLIHNAGVFPMARIEEIDEETLETTLSVNLKAAFRLSAAALPFLKASPAPRILFTSSVTGPRVALPGLAHYAASKSGLNGFIRAAAMEFARHRITVNGVEPGLICTEAMATLGDEAKIAAMAREIPLGRLGDPSEIAYAMLYLASDQAGFVTGQTIIVDGGALLPENAGALEG